MRQRSFGTFKRGPFGTFKRTRLAARAEELFEFGVHKVAILVGVHGGQQALDVGLAALLPDELHGVHCDSEVSISTRILG